MRNNFYVFVLLVVTLVACDAGEFVERAIDNETVENGDQGNSSENEDIENVPCDFNFNDVRENDTLNIACSHDLAEEVIILPANVTINYNGGEIINGTLEFDGGVIDGDLLNQKLTVKGSVKLVSSTFKFNKEKWNIIEGVTSDRNALTNKDIFEKVIQDVKKMGAEVCEIDNLDAYFLVTEDYYVDAAIAIPSNFTLQMTDNTHLRVQPNNKAWYILFMIRDVENVKILGGNLYGDRNKHDYTPIVMRSGIESTTHEWGYLIEVKSGVNITIDGVNLKDSSGDGIEVSSLGFTFNSDYKPSNNITISNCTFDSNRRNNLSITDGYNMLVENNEFLNAGIDTPTSEGTAPRYSIDIEAYRQRDDDGELKNYQIARDITIRGNTEKGSVNGAFTVAIGQDIVIENNVVENSIGFSLASGVKIKNNTILGTIDKPAVSAGKSVDSETIFNNEISGNTISNSGQAIILYNQGVKVYDNIIKDCVTGISIKALSNSEIYNNTISSSLKVCYGIFTHVTNADDVIIRDNDIDISYKPIAFTNVNIGDGEENNKVTIQNNNLNGGIVHISNSNGIIEE